jgi:hypothetical protein
MKKDWSKKTLWTGFVVSALALTLHSSEAVPMHALNPLAVSGCASHQMNFQAAMAPEGGVSSHEIKLKKGKRRSVETLARGTEIFVTTRKDFRYGPLLTYGVDYKRGLLFASRVSGDLMAFSFGEIKDIQAAKEGKVGAGAGWGALAGGVLGAVLAGTATESELGAICGVVIGAPVGATVGAVGGAIAGQDKTYRFGEGKWRVDVPAEPPAPDAEPTSLEKAIPEAAHGMLDEVPEANTPKSDAPPAPADTKKDASAPDVDKKD